MSSAFISRSAAALLLAAACLGAGRAYAQAAPEPPKPAEPAAAPVPPPAPPALKAVPYGIIYFNGFSNSTATNNIDVPMFTTPTGVSNTSATARQTRLGVRLSGVNVGKAKLSGVVETDLYGGFPQIGVGETFGLLRLRQAFARLDWDKVSIEAGQDWMVFAPNNPVSIACAAIPLMASSGNVWMRLPQVRIERRLGTKRFKGLATVAVLAPSSGDSTAGFLFVPSTGAASRVPYVQGRLAFVDGAFLGGKKPMTLGASGHWGQGRVGAGAAARDLDSNGGAVDVNVPFGAKATLLGEAFFGKNLGGFQAAAFQGINPTFPVAGGTAPRAIATQGAWGQLGVTPMTGDKLGLYATFGIDNPKDADLVSTPATNYRTKNVAFSGSFIHKPVALLSWGVEVKRTETSFVTTAKKANIHVNLGVALNF